MSQYGVGVEAAMGAIMSGQNVFVTGPGGTGKTHTIKMIQSLYSGCVLTVAPTGVAAINVDGMTAHRAFGLSMGISTEKDNEKVKPKVKKLLKSKALKILIIEEVSMARADKLWEMDQKCRIARREPNKPFGGLQVAMFGDFFQNLPVLREDEKDAYFTFHETELSCFSKTWKELNPFPVILDKIYRQNSVHFASLLNCVRRGERVSDVVKFLNAHCYKGGEALDGITLTSTNAQADKVNAERFKLIKEPERVYYAEKKGDFSQTPVPEKMALKIGAVVMILVNDYLNEEPEYVNGSRGVVEGMYEDSVSIRLENGNLVSIQKNIWENVEYNPVKVRGSDGTIKEELEKIVIGTYTALPVRLGWAVTIHKAQGLTLPIVNIDFGNGAFAPGMAYVGFSRAKTTKGLRLLRKVKERDIIVDQRIVRFYDETFPINEEN